MLGNSGDLRSKLVRGRETRAQRGCPFLWVQSRRHWALAPGFFGALDTLNRGLTPCEYYPQRWPALATSELVSVEP